LDKTKAPLVSAIFYIYLVIRHNNIYHTIGVIGVVPRTAFAVELDAAR